MQAWRGTARRAIAKMTPDEAKEFIVEYSKSGSIVHSPIRRLTGGFASQSINFYVIRMVGKRAGVVRA